jgi:hypothetical protein
VSHPVAWRWRDPERLDLPLLVMALSAAGLLTPGDPRGSMNAGPLRAPALMVDCTRDTCLVEPT